MTAHGLRSLLILLLTALLIGCSTTQLKESWTNPKHTGAAFTKVLVLGVSSDVVTRRSFEDTFAKALEATGIRAISSYTLISKNGKIDEDKLRAAVAQTGADAVMITRLVDTKRQSQYNPGYLTVMPGSYRGFYGYYGAAWGHYTPPATYTYKVITLETNLWEVKTEDLVWSGYTEITDPQLASEETEKFSKVVIKALKEQRLL